MSDSPETLREELLLGQYIPLHYHFNMLQDRSRMAPFREAIERTVPIGGRVLELGGGTGVLSFFAAQLAERVWCVERNPALAAAARRFLRGNGCEDRVEVVQADARDYLPPEPVDVVICEMLHVGLIREKQLEVLSRFREHYLAQFGHPLPRMIPDTSLLGIQLLEQNFSFDGYVAPVPLFLPPGQVDATRILSDPEIYSTVEYRVDIPLTFNWHGRLTATRDGTLNAIGFLTKNFLAFVLAENRAVTWMMNQLVLPLAEPIAVKAGDGIAMELHYDAGCPLETLQESLDVTQASTRWSARRAA